MDVLLTLFVYVAFGLLALASLIGGVGARGLNDPDGGRIDDRRMRVRRS